MLIISLLLILFGCESGEVLPDSGTIEGNVSIGPLCGTVPVSDLINSDNPCGFTNEQLDGIYGKYKVEISDANKGKTVAKSVILDHTGLFSFRVPVGSYDVKVVMPEGSAPQNTLMNGSSSVKEGLTVTKGEVVQLTFNVNTDIR